MSSRALCDIEREQIHERIPRIHTRRCIAGISAQLIFEFLISLDSLHPFGDQRCPKRRDLGVREVMHHMFQTVRGPTT